MIFIITINKDMLECINASLKHRQIKVIIYKAIFKKTQQQQQQIYLTME